MFESHREMPTTHSEYPQMERNRENKLKKHEITIALFYADITFRVAKLRALAKLYNSREWSHMDNHTKGRAEYGVMKPLERKRD